MKLIEEYLWYVTLAMLCVFAMLSIANGAGSDFLVDKKTMKVITIKSHPATWGTGEINGFYRIICRDVKIDEAAKFLPVYSGTAKEFYFNPLLISAQNITTIKDEGYIFFTSTGVFQCLRELP